MNANHVKRNLPYIIMAIPAVSIFSVFLSFRLFLLQNTVFITGLIFSPDIVFSD